MPVLSSPVDHLRSEILAALKAREAPSRGQIQRWCGAIDVVLVDDPKPGLQLARLAVRLASRSTSHWTRGRAWCALGSAHRHTDQTDHAETCYLLALREGCDLLEPDIWRRLAYVALHRGQYRKAHSLSQRSVAGFLKVGDPARAGRALLARGFAKTFLGDRSGALQDLEEALSLIPRSDSLYYPAALQNLTAFLASPESSSDELKRALGKIGKVRQAIRNHSGYRGLRIRLRWVQLMISHRLGLLRAHRIRRGLARVVAVLTELNMPHDAAAAAADLAAMSARQCRSEEQLENTVAGLCERLAPIANDALKPQIRLLRRATQAINLRREIGRAASELRQACQAHGVPLAIA